MAINNSDTLAPSIEQASLPQGTLRIQILDCILNNIPVKKPYFIITLGGQKLRTSVSEEWQWQTETFDVHVDFHAQLFGTLQLDLYDSNTWLSDKHIGRTEIRLSLLKTMPYSFTNYYELWDKQLSSGASSSVGQETACKNNLGVLRLQLTYRYQLASGLDITLEGGGDHSNKEHPDHSHQRYAVLNETQDQLPSRLSDLLASLPAVSPQLNNNLRADDDLDTEGPPGSTNLVIKETADQDLKRYAKFQRQRVKLKDSNNEYGSILNCDDDDDDGDASDGEKNSESNRWLASAKTQSAHGKPLAAHEFDDVSRSTSTRDQQDDKIATTTTDKESSKDNRQVLGAIGKLLSQFGQGLELSNLQILTGFNLLEKYYAQLPRNRDEGKVVVDLNQVELMGHFWKFALASYGWKGLNFLGKGNGVLADSWRNNSDALSIVEFLSIPKVDLLAYEFRSAEAFRPSYFIALDRSTDAIILSIRGTMSVSDTLTDLVCTYEPWRGGLVHSGMKESAVWFLLNVAPQLLLYCQKHAVSKLYIIGHSMGAGTGACLTIMLMDYLDEFKEKCSDTFTLKCFGYAPACCLDLKLAEMYKEHILSFVSADDIVSKLSYGSMMTVKDMIVAAVEASKLVAPKSSEGDRWKLAFERISKVRDRCLASEDNPRLYVVGQIYQFWLDPLAGDDTRVVIEKTDAKQVCSEVIVQRSVIGDHLPSNFDLAVKRGRETLMRQGDKGRQQQHTSMSTSPKVKANAANESSLSTDDIWNQFSDLKLNNSQT